MGFYTHLVSAAIGGAREGHGPHGTDEARLLARLEGLLASLRRARGTEREALARSVRACEQELALHLDRSGRGVLADALLCRALDGEPAEG